MEEHQPGGWAVFCRKKENFNL